MLAKVAEEEILEASELLVEKKEFALKIAGHERGVKAELFKLWDEQHKAQH